MRLVVYGAGGDDRPAHHARSAPAGAPGDRGRPRSRQPRAPVQRLAVLRGDVLEPASVARTVAGHDAAISAVGPGPRPANTVVQAAHSLIQGLSRAGLRRLLVVGGGG